MNRLNSRRPASELARKLAFVGLLLSASAAGAQAPTVTGPAPFPAYQVGDIATVIVTADPSQSSQIVYRFRLFNGVSQGGEEGVPLGETGADGRFEVNVELIPESVVS